MSVLRTPRGLIFPIASGINGYNVASSSITAPVKRGFFLGCTTYDQSASIVVYPTLTGWSFQMLAVFNDTGTSMNLAMWIGRPLTNLLTSASGTTLTYNNSVANSTWSGNLFRQYDGDFRGEILDARTSSNAGATSVVCNAPTTNSANRRGKVVGLAACVMDSGGVGLTSSASSPADMPDIVASGGLGAIRLSAATGIVVPSSTTFASTRSAKMDSIYLIMR